MTRGCRAFYRVDRILEDLKELIRQGERDLRILDVGRGLDVTGHDQRNHPPRMYFGNAAGGCDGVGVPLDLFGFLKEFGNEMAALSVGELADMVSHCRDA